MGGPNQTTDLSLKVPNPKPLRLLPDGVAKLRPSRSPSCYSSSPSFLGLSAKAIVPSTTTSSPTLANPLSRPMRLRKRSTVCLDDDDVARIHRFDVTNMLDAQEVRQSLAILGLG